MRFPFYSSTTECFLQGLPRLSKQAQTALTTHASPSNYAPINPIRKPYQAQVQFDQLQQPKNVHLWSLAHGDTLHAKKEKAITEFVANLMREIVSSVIISFVNIFNAHRLTLELGPINAEDKCPDVWIVKADHVPVFVIEVKRPGIFEPDKAQNLKYIHGQMYSYLTTLVNYNGVEASYAT